MAGTAGAEWAALRDGHGPILHISGRPTTLGRKDARTLSGFLAPGRPFGHRSAAIVSDGISQIGFAPASSNSPSFLIWLV
jgi:hypothetical protein